MSHYSTSTSTTFLRALKDVLINTFTRRGEGGDISNLRNIFIHYGLSNDNHKSELADNVRIRREGANAYLKFEHRTSTDTVYVPKKLD